MKKKKNYTILIETGQTLHKVLVYYVLPPCCCLAKVPTKELVFFFWKFVMSGLEIYLHINVWLGSLY